MLVLEKKVGTKVLLLLIRQEIALRFDVHFLLQLMQLFYIEASKFGPVYFLDKKVARSHQSPYTYST